MPSYIVGIMYHQLTGLFYKFTAGGELASDVVKTGGSPKSDMVKQKCNDVKINMTFENGYYSFRVIYDAFSKYYLFQPLLCDG